MKAELNAASSSSSHCYQETLVSLTDKSAMPESIKAKEEEHVRKNVVSVKEENIDEEETSNNGRNNLVEKEEKGDDGINSFLLPVSGKRQQQEEITMPIYCSDCGQPFSKTSVLMAHYKTHHKDNLVKQKNDIAPQYCADCGKSFVSMSMLTAHCIVHSRERAYQCPECGKRFGHVGNRNKHLLVVHGTGERPFKCSECGKGFLRSANLKEHQRIHSGENKQYCTVCGKGFTKSRMLRVHQRMHDLEVDHQPPSPGKSRTVLKEHKKTLRFLATGERHHCSECDKTFSSANYLKVHQRSHTGENVYPCATCSKIFTSSSGLKMHMQTHTKVK